MIGRFGSQHSGKVKKSVGLPTSVKTVRELSAAERIAIVQEQNQMMGESEREEKQTELKKEPMSESMIAMENINKQRQRDIEKDDAWNRRINNCDSAEELQQLLKAKSGKVGKIRVGFISGDARVGGDTSKLDNLTSGLTAEGKRLADPNALELD